LAVAAAGPVSRATRGGQTLALEFPTPEPERLRRIADQLTVRALALGLRDGVSTGDAVAVLSSLAGHDEVAIRRAVRRLERGNAAETGVGARAARYLRETLSA
jgi:hypothetical protein